MEERVTKIWSEGKERIAARIEESRQVPAL
jgi:hypothetical protein